MHKIKQNYKRKNTETGARLFNKWTNAPAFRRALACSNQANNWTNSQSRNLHLLVAINKLGLGAEEDGSQDGCEVDSGSGLVRGDKLNCYKKHKISLPVETDTDSCHSLA
jgi:hypothetical protein